MHGANLIAAPGARFVHLLRAPSPGAPIWREPTHADAAGSLCVARALIDEFPLAAHRVVAIGALSALQRRSDQTWASARSVAPPVGCDRLAARSLRLVAADLGPPDVVVCWCPTLTGLAERAWPGGTPITTVNVREARVTTRAGGSQGPVLSASPLRAGWMAAPNDSREQTRAALGVLPGETIIAMAGDADITPLVFVAGILQVAGYSVRGVVAAGARGLRRARRHAWEGSRVPLVVQGGISNMLGASDLLLLARAESDAGLDQRLVMTHSLLAGVPVVAGPGAGLEEIFEGRPRACVARSWAYSDLASVCRGLIENEGTRRECAGLGATPRGGESLGTQLRAAWRAAGVMV